MKSAKKPIKITIGNEEVEAEFPKIEEKHFSPSPEAVAAGERFIDGIKSGKHKNPHHEIYNQDGTIKVVVESVEKIWDEENLTQEEVDALLEPMDVEEDLEKIVIHKEDEDSVDHPSHYGGKDNPYEAIKVINAWNLNFELGNVVKYLSRAGRKNPEKTVEDLRKALWYLDYEIKKITNKEED